MAIEVRLAGTGGQGIILIGNIIAEAAVMYDGKNATQNTAYGGQVRGGDVRSDILIGDFEEEIVYPEVRYADVLLVMSQEAADRFTKNVKDDGIIVVDTTNINKIPDTKAYIHKFPITEIAAEGCKNRSVANMVALGIIIELTKIVSKKAIEELINMKSPKGTGETNRKAWLLGCKIFQSHNEKISGG